MRPEVLVGDQQVGPPPGDDVADLAVQPEQPGGRRRGRGDRLREGDAGETGAIAGGTARLLDVVRRAVRDAGVPLADAVTAATATPARLLGLDAEVGDVVPGLRADLLITDDVLVPHAVLRAGRWVAPLPTDPAPVPTRKAP